MSDPSRPEGKTTTWRTPLRTAFRFGFPIAGIVVIARAIIASIGGDIEPAHFMFGLLLIVLTVSARLVPGR